jgi:hypothetical protein
MIRSEEEVLIDIDATLDQLIQNAETMSRISLDTFFVDEVQALENTQESLFARLIHMNELLDQDEKRNCFRKRPVIYAAIEQKIAQCEQWSDRGISQVRQDLSAAKKPNCPKIRKNRKRIKVPC